MLTPLPKHILNSPTILISGETGVGKSVAAKRIYKESTKYSERFVTVHLASLSDELIESELFGHEKGAFTGAISRKIGSIESAGRGTLFLDEVGELSLESQKRLLYLLEERKYSPVGSTGERIFYGRIICATNCDLLKMVENGEFRKDLYFRLLISQHHIAPLRERTEEILQLAHTIAREMVTKFAGIEVQFSPDMKQFLNQYYWPGNTRELKNLIEHLHHSECIYARKKDLPSWINKVANKDADDVLVLDYRKALKSFERKYLESVLNHFNGAVNRTAKEIGVSKATLIAKSRKYGINTWQIKANYLENYLRVA